MHLVYSVPCGTVSVGGGQALGWALEERVWVQK